jgi:carbamoyl-phosphate synthase large subunit
LKILITSAGSLVGQNILDALEGRRGGVRVIGVNSLAQAASNFRCDVCYTVPMAANEERYHVRLLEIMESELPDLILAGRDDDVIALAAIREQNPRHAARIACGSLAAARTMGDKFLSCQFARQHGLPFADTACGDERELLELVARRGYPLIAKPRRGHGSQGVLVIQNRAQLARAATLADYVFQEYIDPPSNLDTLLPDPGFGAPLFYSLPELWQFSLQAVIAPCGEVVNTFCLVNDVMVAGRTEQNSHADDPALVGAIDRYARALADVGWAGPLFVQGRKTEDGRFVAFEMNGRLGGSVSSLLRFGFDQLGLLAHHFASAQRLAASPVLGGTGVTVYKSLCDFPVRHADVAMLKENGMWRRFS